MKKLFLVILTLTMTVCFLSIDVSANLLSECHICRTTGKCDKCHGEKSYVCDRCNGSGKDDCDQCDDGYMTCHMCNGQKKIPCCDNPNCQNCYGTGTRDCGNCNGTGLEKCNGCKGTQLCSCNGCAGTGRVTCDRCNGTGICVDCRGTGYLSGKNDGVNNVPKKGDTVELSVTGGGKTIIWGSTGGSTGGNTGGTSGTKPDDDRTNTTGDASQTQTSVSSHMDTAQTPEREYSIPENRAEINIGENDQPATAFFHMDDMTDTEKDALEAMPEEELKQVLRDVDAIISSMKIGELSEKSEEALTQVLEKNKIQDSASVKLCKLNFEGHITLNFPVKVSVSIDSSYFTQEDTIYAYHIADDGTVEFLGEAWSYADDGKVTRIEFMTKSFSDFFVTTQKLETEKLSQPSTVLSEDNNHHWIYYASGAALILLVALTVILIEIKKRKKQA